MTTETAPPCTFAITSDTTGTARRATSARRRWAYANLPGAMTCVSAIAVAPHGPWIESDRAYDHYRASVSR